MIPVDRIGSPEGIVGSSGAPGGRQSAGAAFAASLREAVQSVDRVQQESEAAQASYARGEQVELHDVLIKIEEAEIAFKMMMEVRNKLVEAYREVMRMGV